MNSRRPEWQAIASADYRIAALADAAVLVAAVADNPDQVYCEARRHAAALVGWRRGYPPDRRSDTADELDIAVSLAPAVVLPKPAHDPRWLYGEVAFNAVCAHLHDTIMSAALRGRAA